METDDILKHMTMYEVFLLHSRADRALRNVVSLQLASFKLSMMEWLLLATVCNGPKVGMTMTEVATALAVTLPQVTALMNGLVKQKLIKQVVTPSDHRSRRLVGTTAGKNLLTKAEKVVTASLQKWFDSIPQDQISHYVETLKYLSSQKPPG